jgi:hypothetical protein
MGLLAYLQVRFVETTNVLRVHLSGQLYNLRLDSRVLKTLQCTCCLVKYHVTMDLVERFCVMSTRLMLR